MKALKQITIIAILLVVQESFAQEFTLKASAGFSGVGSPFDGYYFSTDIAFPLYKGFEIAPTFTSCSDITHSKIYYNWDSYTNEVKTNVDNQSDGYLASYYELFIIAKPLNLFNKLKSNKFDFGVGIGYGFKTFEYHVYSFIGDNLSAVIDKKGIRQNLSARAFLNVNFEKYSLGLVIGGQDLSDEGSSILGLQICASID